MSISQGTMDAIKPKGCVKPSIEIDGYIFRWNEVSFGIPPQDESLFKAFMSDASRCWMSWCTKPDKPKT